MYSQFALFGVGPVVFINVFDPATHKTNVAAEEKTFADDKITLAHPGLVADPTVQDSTDTTTYVLDTDYTVDRITGVITRLSAGSIGATDTVHVTYDYGDPSLVDSDDIIGGIDGSTGAKSGMELIDEVFPRFRLVPGILAAPGWSHTASVAAVMGTKAASINGLFRAVAVVDIDSSGTGVTKYSDASTWKTNNNYTDNNMVVCWPKLKLDSKEYWLSTQAAGLMGRVDADNDSIPYESPSNKNLEMNGLILKDGTEVILDPSEANYLNSIGIATGLNWGSGWRLWGNRTGAYPATTDVIDAITPSSAC
jgi:phage tail sheath protein FI